MVNNKYTIESEDSVKFYANINEMREQLQITNEQLNSKDDNILRLNSQLININEELYNKNI